MRRFSLGAETKPESWKGLKPTAAMPVGEAKGYLAVDDSASPTVIWIGGAWSRTCRIEDSGADSKFGDVRRFEAPSVIGKHSLDNIPCSNVVVDRLRKEVYCRVGGNGRSNARFSEQTGQIEVVEVNPRFILGGGAGLQVVPAPNGNLYGQQWEQSFYQWDRNGKPLAWAEPYRVTEEDKKVGGRPGTVPNENVPPYEAVVGTAMGVLPHTLGVRWSDGHLFVIQPYRWIGRSVGGRIHKALHEYLPSGRKVTAWDKPIIWKLTDAAVGPRFDAAGNIYVAEAIRPENWVLPTDLAEYFAKNGATLTPSGKRGGHGTRYVGAPGIAAGMYGSILKFRPKGGMLQVDRGHQDTEPYIGEPQLDPALKTVDVDWVSGGPGYLWTASTPRGIKVTGAEWIHPGIGHVGQFACNCENVTFDVDEFGRVFFPDTPMFRVCVIDSNGNPIATFGGYGDANYMGPESSVVDPKTDRLRPRQPGDPKDLKGPYSEPQIAFSWLLGVAVTDQYAYFGDSRNQRLLRAKLVYAAEERRDLK